MSYAFHILDHEGVDDDVIRIYEFLNTQNSELGNDFLVALGDTFERLEKRYKREVPSIPQMKFQHFYGEPIVANKNSPASAKKFKKYYVWYVLDKSKAELAVIAIEYALRDPDYLLDFLGGRESLS